MRGREHLLGIDHMANNLRLDRDLRSRRKPTITVFQMNIAAPNDILPCHLVSVSLSHHQRSFSYTRWELIQRPTSGQCAESETLKHTVLSRVSSSNPSPQGSESSVEEENKKIVRPREDEATTETVSIRSSRAVELYELS